MVRLVVKNAGQTDFPIELPDSATVSDLKAELQKSYPSRPTPAQQKLIFAGRLLNDGSQVISQLITTIKYDVNAPQAVHLVLPPPSLHSSASGLPTSPMVNRIHAQADLRRSAPAGLGAQLPPQHVPHNGQPHPRFVPGNGVAAPFARPQFVPAPAPPAAAPAAAPPLAPAVLAGLGLLGRQNWGLLVKLIVIVYIFSQGGGSWRMTFLWVGAFVVYLYQMGLFPRFNRPAAAAAPAPAPAQPVPPAAAPARADNNAEGEQVPPQADDDNNNNDNPAVAAAAPVPATTTAAAPAQQAPARGLWQEVENIFLPFLYSLIPTWQPAAMAQPVPLPGGQPPQVPVHHNHPHHD